MMVICILGCCLTNDPAHSSGLEDAIPDCPCWVAEADDFLGQCQTYAREYTTTFYPGVAAGRGEQERHFVWFATAPANQHFMMGCTLRFDHSLSYFGLYYTMEPSALGQANTAPIVGVGFDGDITLFVDGHPVTFVAVQPFETDKIRTRWSNVPEVSKNCESPTHTDGRTRSMSRRFADFSRFDHDGIVEVGAFPTTLEASEYIEFFPSALPRELIYSWGDTILVTTSGSLLVKKDWFPAACFKGDPERIANSPLLLHQLCRIVAPSQTTPLLSK